MSDFTGDVDLGGESQEPANNIVPFARGLDGISKMIEDRNRLLKFYFREDVYKDFLLAERLQDISNADNQTTSSTSESINLDKQEVDKTQNYFRRFSNFLNPGDLPRPDLDPIIFSDDVTLEGPEKEDEDEDEEKKKGGTLLDAFAGLFKKKESGGGGSTTVKSAYGNVISPQSSMLGAVGGTNNNLNVSNNLLTPPEDRPQVESLKESGFEEGMEKNISDKFDTEFGIDSKMKDALSKAMALPLQVVAGGLMGLMAKTPVKSNEQKQDLMKSLSFISNAFGIPASTLENVPDDPAMLQSGVSNTRPTPASQTGGASMNMPSGNSSGSGKQWWNPFSWFKNDDSPTPTGQGGSGPIMTGPAITNMMTNNTMNASAHGDSSSSSSFSPTSIATNLFSQTTGDSRTQNTEETTLGSSNTDILQTLFGGATNLATNVINGADGHVHAIEISKAESPIQDKKPDLMSLTTKLESEVMQRKEEQTTSMTQSFASAAAASASPMMPSGSGTSTLNSGSNRAGLEESDSPFFEVFSATSQYA